MKAVILAGGKGTRLAPIIGPNTPKALAIIGDAPIIEHQLRFLKENGLKEVWVLLGHLGNEVQKFLEKKEWGMVLRYKQEEEPRGTAGALKQLEDETQEDFLVLAGDVMVNFDAQRFLQRHKEKGGILSVMVHPNDHPFDSDLVEVNEQGRVLSILRRPHPDDLLFRNLSIASVYICSPKVFEYIPDGEKTDMEKDIFPRMLEAGEHISAYNTPEYIKDMGTPERLEQVRKDYASGKIVRLSLTTERRAIFLDRDGVLNEEIDQLSRAEDLKVYDFATEAVKKINETDFMAIVVSNQPMVAKGFMTEKDVDEIHKKLETELGRKGAKLDAAYFCPHHPEKGFSGERLELKIECECRKPKPGLLLNAREDFHINLSASYMIGDQTSDILAGKNAGCRTILVETGYGGKDEKYKIEPDFKARNILEAVELCITQTK
ncbi:MAG TPA: HAD-IIIA family hydrolase [Candidatus Paceibacterota bacterium]